MSTPTFEPVLAREFPLEINTGTTQAPTWTPIRGIQSITPAQTAQRTDDTDFDTDGWEAHTVAMRGRSLSVAMQYEIDEVGTPDPGQEALIALGDATGRAAKAQFRYGSDDLGGVHTFRASADVAWPGGEKTANASLTAELTVDGKPTYTPAP